VQCEESTKKKVQNLNIREREKRAEGTHIKEHEKNKEIIDRKIQQVKPSMNKAKE
jgi:hypothetical protein